MTHGRVRQQMATEGGEGEAEAERQTGRQADGQTDGREDGRAEGVRDFGREAAVARAQMQSPALRRIRRDLDCEPPWDIGEIHVSGHQDRYDVWVFDQAGYWPCPSCRRQLAGRDHTPTHVYRCLTCETETFVYVKIPIVECPEHGSQRVEIPWGRHQDKWSYSRTLAQTERDCPAETSAGGR